jgi:hypothetical protein
MKLRLLFLGLFLMVGTMFSFASTAVKVVQPAVTKSVQPAVNINEAARTISVGKPADAKKLQDGSFYFVDCWGREWYVEYWGMTYGEAVEIADYVSCYML